MRIYTEVIFEWDVKQGKLVEKSSKSFDYHGELALCYGWERTRVWWGEDGKQYSHRWWLGAGTKNSQVKEHRLEVRGEGGAWKPIWRDKLNHGKSWSRRRVKEEYVKRTSNTHYFPKEDDLKAWLSANPDVNLDVSDTVGGPEKTAAIDAIKGSQAEWDRISKGDSEFQRSIDDAYDTFQRASGGVEGETYTTTDAFGRTIEHDVLGDYEAAEETYETTTERAQEAYTGAKEKYGWGGTLWSRLADDMTTSATRLRDDYQDALEAGDLSKARSLEDKITAQEAAGVGRERGLAGARKAFTPAIREAEAKTAMTGFAGSGAGEMAREALAEEFRAEGKDIEVDFRTARETAETTAARQIEDVDIAMGEALETRDEGIEDASTIFERGKEDYATLVDEARTTWEDATEDAGTTLGGAASIQAGAKATYDSTVTSQVAAAKNALRQLQVDMAGYVSTARDAMADQDWNPYTQAGANLGTGEEYGWMEPKGMYDETEVDKNTPTDPSLKKV